MLNKFNSLAREAREARTLHCKAIFPQRFDFIILD